MHLGSNIKVAALVFDFEGVVIFTERVVVVSEKLDDRLFDADDGLLRIVRFESFVGGHVR